MSEIPVKPARVERASGDAMMKPKARDRRIVSKPFLGRCGVFALGGGVVSAVLWGCLFGSGVAGGGDVDGSGVPVTVSLQTEALAKATSGVSGKAGATTALRPVDSALVRVTAPDMDTLRFGFRLTGGTQALSLIDIPAGNERIFTVTLYQAGQPLYVGSATTELRTDRTNAVSVNCLPQFSRVTASLHIPVDFPKTVSAGRLTLAQGAQVLNAPMSVSGELRHFRIEEVPGDLTYAVSLVLWDPAGDTIATATRADVVIPKGQNIALVMPLALAYTLIGLTMTVADPATTSLVLSFPGGRRTPAAFGDVVFSELYPVPATEEGGDNGEWLELFNRAADTLDLAGCALTRDAGTGTGMNFVIPANTTIAPGRGLVFGRSAVAFAQVMSGSSLTLTNTAARLDLSCPAAAGGSFKVDSLKYGTSTTDTLIARIAPAKVSSLKPSRLSSRHKSDAWCLSTSTSVAPVSGETSATPGTIFGGCGE